MTARLALALLACGLVSAAAAKEYQISAQSMQRVDGLMEFTGAVTVAGDDLSAAADSLSFDEATGVYQLLGKPARLELVRAGETTVITGERIEYFGNEQLARLARGGQLESARLSVAAGWLEYRPDTAALTARDLVRVTSAELAASGASLAAGPLGQSIRLVMQGSPVQLTVALDDRSLAATANQFEYDQAQAVVKLSGEVEASVGDETLTGAAISYDLARDTFVAAPGDDGRVRAVIKLP